MSFDIETPTQGQVTTGPSNPLGPYTSSVPYSIPYMGNVLPFPTMPSSLATDERYAFNSNQARIDIINQELAEVQVEPNCCATDCPICEHLREELAILEAA